MVSKAHSLARYLYIVVLAAFMVTFWGNILHVTQGIAGTIPWHAALFDIVSARNDLHPLPNCHLVNDSTLDKVLMMYIENNSVAKEWRQHCIQKILVENEWRLTWPNKRLVVLAQRKQPDPLHHIHAIFRDILMTRANQSTYKGESMKNLLPIVKRQMDWHYRKSTGNKPGIE